ncbi:MAG: hypothetical protein A3F10_02160 [Coxiella sp. RIFCSPHIGHO2_12_FULL_42_15]|nr:MAG: hypothetical protein A3F10_02160 [Coxiella sp. RIFCSPHIGHO2_12_FULL_42_15]
MLPVTFNDVPAECINFAAIAYHVPATLILSILKTEDGRNGTAKRNANGSYDYGPFQINSWWLPTLKRFSITREDIQFNPCINAMVGTWILVQALTETKFLPQGVGNYNSHTPHLNQRYSQQVLRWYRLFNEKAA